LTPGALWPSVGRSRTVDVCGPARLTEYGDPRAAEVIVCLHGLGGSALNFGLVVPLLTEGRRVLVPDLLGHGHSYATAPDEPCVDSQLRTLSVLLARETRRPVILVGALAGWDLAMMHAARLAESVKGLVLLDPPVPNVTRWSRDPRLTVKLALLRVPGVAALVARQVAALTPEQLVARQLSQATPHHNRIPAEVVEATVRETAVVRVPMVANAPNKHNSAPSLT
jgi:pimeloyl-ACP methyl ester carboxylesterase